jgi:N-acetylglucosaminyldiphosphoundecaprenol N-acetyl-beta-D-mannosaminyltransferase
VPFDSYAEAVKCAEDAIAAGRKTFWVAINPEKIHTAMKDSRLRAVLEKADAGLCDGIGVTLAAKLLHGRAVKRCTGCDLFFHLITRAAEAGWRVFLLGASPESNERACALLAARYPGLQIAGRQHGYFEDSQQVIRAINESHADVVFVAMGSPKQEFWIAEHREAIAAPFCMGVGGTFDVASGTAKRAPRIFQKTGTEYLYQVVVRPGWTIGVRWERSLARLRFLGAVIRAVLGRHGMGGPTQHSADATAADGAGTRAWPWPEVASQGNAEGTHGNKHTTA